jgi:hypothetical protein
MYKAPPTTQEVYKRKYLTRSRENKKKKKNHDN